MNRGTLASFCLALVCASSIPAMAQPSDDARSPARDLATLGVVRFDAGDFEDARDLFHRAYLLVPAPTLLIRESRALARLGRLMEAEDACARTAAWKLDDSSPEPFRAAVAQAKDELPALRTRIPKLRVVVLGGAPVDVRVDAVKLDPTMLGVDRPVDPGTHRIEVVSGAAVIASESIVLAEADSRTLELRSTPGPAPVEQPAHLAGSASAWRTAGWAALATGAGGLAVGVTTGLLAGSKKSTLDDSCPASSCPASSQGDLDSFRTLRTVSTVGYVVGIAGVAAGATILLTKPGTPRDPMVTAYVGPASAGFSGRF